MGWTPEIRECGVCRETFVAHHYNQYVCSDECRRLQAQDNSLEYEGYGTRCELPNTVY